MDPLIGPYGGSAAAVLEQVRDAGGTAVWFHGFDSSLSELCRAAGLAACVEMKTLRADFSKRPELVPIGVDGNPIRYGRSVQGVCLSHGCFLDEIEAELREGLRSMEPAGVWLDYLSYGGWFEVPDPDLQQNCLCPDCVREFCSAVGVDAESPREILRQHEREWIEHKCRRMAALAARYARVIREVRRGCIVGAYMCPWRPDEHDGALRSIFGQDYLLLAEHVDVFTPLIYCRKCGRDPDWGRRFLDGADDFVPRDSKIQLILDVLDFPESLMETARSARPSWGVQLFGGAEIFGDEKSRVEFRRAADMVRRSWKG